jgi:hypothetical protein
LKVQLYLYLPKRGTARARRDFTSRASNFLFANERKQTQTAQTRYTPDRDVLATVTLTQQNMPKILVRDPAWLARPTPGYQLFQQDSTSKSQQSHDARYEGPLRKIAHRGSEVFVAVGNELRWSELGLMKDVGEDFEREHGRHYNVGGQQEPGEKVYRVRTTQIRECNAWGLTRIAATEDSRFAAHHSAVYLPWRRVHGHSHLPHMSHLHPPFCNSPTTTRNRTAPPQNFSAWPNLPCFGTGSAHLRYLASSLTYRRMPCHGHS